MIRFKPTQNRVLIEPLDGQLKFGNIHIPDSAKEKPTEGIIVSIGRGKIDKNGEITPMEVLIGDRVLYNMWGGTDIKINGKKYKMLNHNELLAKLE